MHLSHYILLSLWSVILILSAQSVKAQLGYSLEIKKPEPYENRELRAEKSGRKKFTKAKRFFQNTYTHYNYFFNANNKLNDVIARAKEANIDDYAELLPFYNYSLEITAQENVQLDSIVSKAKTGIVMHDLRNDWIDDMYLPNKSSVSAGWIGNHSLDQAIIFFGSNAQGIIAIHSAAYIAVVSVFLLLCKRIVNKL